MIFESTNFLFFAIKEMLFKLILNQRSMVLQFKFNI